MKIVIIEDERLTANDLELTIHQVDSTIEVAAKLLSVKDALRYFKDNEVPDLIFSDIQLGDGLSFEIFKASQLNVPVIFCTAYDEYALTAFDSNGIAYLLKPFTIGTVGEALRKFKRLTRPAKQEESLQLQNIMRLFESRQTESVSSLLVNYKDKILPVKFQDIAVFYLENEMVHLVTFDQRKFHVGKYLEEIESMAGKNFYRANRQYLVNRNAIVDVSNQLGRKLWVNVSVTLKESIVVSKDKQAHFLKWLSGA